MKHLILSGGRPWLSKDDGRHWVGALLSRCGREVRIAYCLFAQEESEWPETLRYNQELVKRHAASNQTVEFKILEAETFVDVSAWANVIVIVGGDPGRLKNTLEQYGNLMELWDGKTISGSSAGAYIMAERYMYLQDRVVQEGFGWVPVNVIAHWRADWKGWEPADWDWAAHELAGQPGEVPLLCIREGDFVEVEVK